MDDSIPRRLAMPGIICREAPLAEMDIPWSRLSSESIEDNSAFFAMVSELTLKVESKSRVAESRTVSDPNRQSPTTDDGGWNQPETRGE